GLAYAPGGTPAGPDPGPAVSVPTGSGPPGRPGGSGAVSPSRALTDGVAGGTAGSTPTAAGCPGRGYDGIAGWAATGPAVATTASTTPERLRVIVMRPSPDRRPPRRNGRIPV